MKINIEYEVGDEVSLPFNETGIIVKILDILWGFKYIVKLRKVNPVFDNKTNQHVDYKYEQLSPLKDINANVV